MDGRMSLETEFLIFPLKERIELIEMYLSKKMRKLQLRGERGGMCKDGSVVFLVEERNFIHKYKQLT